MVVKLEFVTPLKSTVVAPVPWKALLLIVVKLLAFAKSSVPSLALVLLWPSVPLLALAKLTVFNFGLL